MAWLAVTGTGVGQTKVRIWMLYGMWVAGLIAGILSYLRMEAADISLVRGTASTVGLFGIYVLPFLFTALISGPELLFPICFGRAFLRGFAAVCFGTSFGPLGGLVRGSVLCGAALCDLFLLLLWRASLSGRKSRSLRSAVFCIVPCLAACALEHYIISPLLACLIEN